MVDESPHNLSFSKICEAAEVTNFTFLCSGMKTSMMTRVGVAMDHAWARLQIDCAEHNLNSGPAGRDLAPGRIRWAFRARHGTCRAGGRAALCSLSCRAVSEAVPCRAPPPAAVLCRGVPSVVPWRVGGRTMPRCAVLCRAVPCWRTRSAVLVQAVAPCRAVPDCQRPVLAVVPCRRQCRRSCHAVSEAVPCRAVPFRAGGRAVPCRAVMWCAGCRAVPAVLLFRVGGRAGGRTTHFTSLNQRNYPAIELRKDQLDLGNYYENTLIEGLGFAKETL